eukprot:CAMPEP_0114129826 /NCGR_PEP_ID=MMETSP0043_2-20121206/11682_1 /TAXON_ID=464988 /ORGANISM="Hemiselmis andersenii, Strain CCMP644" /LENGTH=644 /DNA_ID=CAMNT_0001223127 /DNA_START=134 /DNA_END=2068 /DNA_ORIENTATION=-
MPPTRSRRSPGSVSSSPEACPPCCVAGASPTARRRAPLPSVVLTVLSLLGLFSAAVGEFQGGPLGAPQPLTNGPPQPSDNGLPSRPALEMGEPRRRWRGGPAKAGERPNRPKLTKMRCKSEDWAKKVPLFVMLPLDTVHPENNTLNQPDLLRERLVELKRAGCEGVMADIWWGIVEQKGPLMYDWSGYDELVSMVADVGLKLQAVMSFHQCGGNVGDECTVTLPPWVLRVGESNHEVWYTDMDRNRNTEYISLGADHARVFYGRTPLEMYRDLMQSFADRYLHFIPDVIIEAQIGLGPAGEMRYPSYPLKHWSFPGTGQFQCYDKYMRKDLIQTAIKCGKPDLGLVWPPHPDDVGVYSWAPEHTTFFRDGGIWETPEADFFLKWYSSALIRHGEEVLKHAVNVFKGTNILLAAKVAGIHWQAATNSHAAEVTAGYYRTVNRDGYGPIAQMFARQGVMFDFTCLEMSNSEIPEWARSRPADLVQLVKLKTAEKRCLMAGENALPRHDRKGYEKMQEACLSGGKSIASFTYLRLGHDLMDDGPNWMEFTRFAAEMAHCKVLPTWSAPPPVRQSRRAGSHAPPLVFHHHEDGDSPVYFGGRQIMGPGVRRTITEPDLDAWEAAKQRRQKSVQGELGTGVQVRECVRE